MTRSIHRDLLLPLAAFFLAGDVINNKNRYSHAAFSKFEESAFSKGLVEHQYFSQESSDRNVAVRNHRSLATLPLGLVNQTKEEENYLKLHKCRDPGEAYGASYLITKEHLINQFTGTKRCTIIDPYIGNYFFTYRTSIYRSESVLGEL